MVNYEEAIKKPFTDLGKMLFGIIISFIPIVNWIAQGFVLECSGVGKNKPSKKMPEWKEMPDLFVKGFLSYAVMFVYAIPAILIFTITVGYAIISWLATFGGIMPKELMNSMMAGQASSGELAPVLSQNWALALPTLIAITPLLMIGLILALIASYLSPIAVLNYVKNKKFVKAFDFNFIFSKAFTANYFITWLIAGVITMVIGLVLSVIPWIGSAIAFFIAGVISYSLYGEVFREK